MWIFVYAIVFEMLRWGRARKWSKGWLWQSRGNLEGLIAAGSGRTRSARELTNPQTKR